MGTLWHQQIKPVITASLALEGLGHGGEREEQKVVYNLIPPNQ